MILIRIGTTWSNFSRMAHEQRNPHLPLRANRWAVQVGTTKLQAFETREEALQFGEDVAAKKEDAQIVIHEDRTNEFPHDQAQWDDDNVTLH